MSHTLITGASSGLGIEFARQMAAKKRNLILVARSRDKMEILASELRLQYGIDVQVLGSDLSQVDAVSDIMRYLSENSLKVDILINNAGFGDFSDVAKADSSKVLSMIDLNVRALTELTQAFLPTMVQRRHGYILNVASTAAFQPGPGMAVYFASKAYVHSFTRAVRQEAKAYKVRVSTLCPGPTATGFGEAAGAKVVDKFSKFGPTASEVVRQALEGLAKNQALIIPGLGNKIGVFLARHLPQPWVVSIAGLLFRQGVKKN